MVKVPSILYTPEQAASLDRAQLSSLGSSALIELDVLAASAAGKASPGFFSSFEAMLVGSGAAGTLSGPRELLDQTQIVQLDAALDSLLGSLRPHLLERAGLKLLEFLLRVHAVHKHRPRQLLLMALPYHATPAYAKLVPLLLPHLPAASALRKLPPRPTTRSALVVAAASKASNGATMPSRNSTTNGEALEGLVSACCTDLLTSARALTAQDHGEASESRSGEDGCFSAPNEGGVGISFCTVLLMEALPQLIASSAEASLLPVLQMILELLEPRVPACHAHAAMLVLTQLVSHANLSTTVTSALASRLASLTAAADTAASASAALVTLAVVLRHARAATGADAGAGAGAGAGKRRKETSGITPCLFGRGKGGSVHAMEAIEQLSAEHDLSLLLPAVAASLHATSPATNDAALSLFSSPAFSSGDGATTLATLVHELSAGDAASLSQGPEDEAGGDVSTWLADIISLRHLRMVAQAEPPSLLSPSAARRLLALNKILAAAEAASVAAATAETVTSAPTIALVTGAKEGAEVARAAVLAALKAATAQITAWPASGLTDVTATAQGGTKVPDTYEADGARPRKKQKGEKKGGASPEHVEPAERPRDRSSRGKKTAAAEEPLAHAVGGTEHSAVESIDNTFDEEMDEAGVAARLDWLQGLLITTLVDPSPIAAAALSSPMLPVLLNASPLSGRQDSSCAPSLSRAALAALWSYASQPIRSKGSSPQTVAAAVRARARSLATLAFFTRPSTQVATVERPIPAVPRLLLLPPLLEATLCPSSQDAATASVLATAANTLNLPCLTTLFATKISPSGAMFNSAANSHELAPKPVEGRGKRSITPKDGVVLDTVLGSPDSRASEDQWRRDVMTALGSACSEAEAIAICGILASPPSPSVTPTSLFLLLAAYLARFSEQGMPVSSGVVVNAMPSPALPVRKRSKRGGGASEAEPEPPPGGSEATNVNIRRLPVPSAAICSALAAGLSGSLRSLESSREHSVSKHARSEQTAEHLTQTALVQCDRIGMEHVQAVTGFLLADKDQNAASLAAWQLLLTRAIQIVPTDSDAAPALASLALGAPGSLASGGASVKALFRYQWHSHALAALMHFWHTPCTSGNSFVSAADCQAKLQGPLRQQRIRALQLGGVFIRSMAGMTLESADALARTIEATSTVMPSLLLLACDTDPLIARCAIMGLRDLQSGLLAQQRGKIGLDDSRGAMSMARSNTDPTDGLQPSEVPKMKVDALKAALSTRGLSTAGKKADLVVRLSEALSSDACTSTVSTTLRAAPQRSAATSVLSETGIPDAERLTFLVSLLAHLAKSSPCIGSLSGFVAFESLISFLCAHLSFHLTQQGATKFRSEPKKRWTLYGSDYATGGACALLRAILGHRRTARPARTSDVSTSVGQMSEAERVTAACDGVFEVALGFLRAQLMGSEPDEPLASEVIALVGELCRWTGILVEAHSVETEVCALGESTVPALFNRLIEAVGLIGLAQSVPLPFVALTAESATALSPLFVQRLSLPEQLSAFQALVTAIRTQPSVLAPPSRGTSPPPVAAAAAAGAALSSTLRATAAAINVSGASVLQPLLKAYEGGNRPANDDSLRVWIAEAEITLEVLSSRGLATEGPSVLPALLQMIGVLTRHWSRITKTHAVDMVGEEMDSALGSLRAELTTLCALALAVACEAIAPTMLKLEMSHDTTEGSVTSPLEPQLADSGHATVRDALRGHCGLLLECIVIAESEARGHMTAHALSLVSLAAKLLPPTDLCSLLSSAYPPDVMQKVVGALMPSILARGDQAAIAAGTGADYCKQGEILVTELTTVLEQLADLMLDTSPSVRSPLLHVSIDCIAIAAAGDVTSATISTACNSPLSLVINHLLARTSSTAVGGDDAGWQVAHELLAAAPPAVALEACACLTQLALQSLPVNTASTTAPSLEADRGRSSSRANRLARGRAGANSSANSSAANQSPPVRALASTLRQINFVTSVLCADPDALVPRRAAAAAAAPRTAAATSAAASAAFTSLVNAAELAVTGLDNTKRTGGSDSQSQELNDTWEDLWDRIQTSMAAVVEMIAGVAGVALLEPIGSMLCHTHRKLRKTAVALLSSQLSTLLPDTSGSGEMQSPAMVLGAAVPSWATAAPAPPAAATPHLLSLVSRLRPFLVPKSTSGRLEVPTKDRPELDSSTSQAALLSIDLIARALAGTQPGAFDSCIDPALEALRYPDAPVATAAALLLSTLATRLGAQLLSRLSVLLPAMYEAFDGFFETFRPTAATSLAVTLLYAPLPALLASFPSLLGPYLPALLLRLLPIGIVPLPGFSRTAAPAITDAAMVGDNNVETTPVLAEGPPTSLLEARGSLMRALAKVVTPRVMLKALGESIPLIEAQAPTALSAVFDMLTEHIRARPAAEVATHRVGSFSLLQAALTFRRSHPVTIFELSETVDVVSQNAQIVTAQRTSAAIELAAGEALVELTTRLNEAQLRPLIDRALSWAREEVETVEASGAMERAAAGQSLQRDVAHSEEAKLSGETARRAVAYFALIAPSQTRFGALYAPYFALSLPFASTVLTVYHVLPRLLPSDALPNGPAPEVDLSEELRGDTSAAKRRKKLAQFSPSEGQRKAAITTEEASSSRSAVLGVLRYLASGLEHQRVAPAVSLDLLSQLQAPLTSALTAAAFASAAGNCSDSTAASAPAASVSAEILVEEAITTIGVLAGAVGADGCKVLHYQLCLAARSEADDATTAFASALPASSKSGHKMAATQTLTSSVSATIAANAAAAARCASLRALRALYAALGEGGLSHVAEALPVASEAMEDESASVRQAALTLMRSLEALDDVG